MPPVVPTNSVSLDDFNETPTQVLIFSVLLQAFLYMSGDGELRLKSPCQAVEGDMSLSLFKYCERTEGGSKLCFYTSTSESRALVMNAHDGMLLSIAMPKTRRTFVDSHGHCMLFRERELNLPGGKSAISIESACGNTTAQPLVFQGKSYPSTASCDVTAGPFFQVPSSRDAGPKQTLHIPPAYTEILKSKLKCDRYGETQQQCPGQIRSSYPLLWNPAKKCKNNRQASPLPTATETSQPAAE